ncbi:IS66 family insertion sequence element accessory protein TnpB [Paraburkholderia saeva]|uniref:IS66 family insertion sequence element accessory protein TnpB n=1 Tax=Paraburkholderia saeva TaxID=2777537 RepID=UPI0039824615
MRTGADTARTRAVTVVDAAHARHACIFANKRANRLKMLIHDGIRIWLAAHRLHRASSSGRWPGVARWYQATLSVSISTLASPRCTR